MVLITVLLFIEAAVSQMGLDVTLVILVFLVMIFEFGPGPICWIYMSEIMNDKGVAVATSLNWTFCLIYTIVSPFSLTHSYVFYTMAVACGFGALFVIFYVKETRGLTEQQLS
jgi:hypothetical protein